ncbi:major facilitator superfamily domain-containing protein [Mycena rosella]|uniref:Major facilitator superfamily domain-containing protein n=1 Tax=Mycena rosella TaxID=1033263 RepID=A0AAD7D3X6_MYCRO|nr:major facilitator superfamily domain-containing protein [Mycena rosella]
MEAPLESPPIYPPTAGPEGLAVESETAAQTSQPSRRQIILARVQTITLCWAVFLAGFNDGSLGPLLPRIQRVYHVGYLIVSLLFVFQAIGAITGAVLTMTLTPKLGFGKILGYSLQAAALPFPVFVLSCVLTGIGVSILDAQANGYVASVSRNPETRMGYVQAAYGAGIFAAPLVSTQFAQLQHWSFHYLVSLGLTFSNLLSLFLVFRGKTQNECLAQLGQAEVPKGDSGHSHMRQILSIKAVHLMALFLFVHVGASIAISGWTVSFMVSVRGGGASAGYIAAGYAGGAVLGRIALIWVNKKIGETRGVYIYSIVAIGLQLVVWLVPSLISGAIAVAFVGLMTGPIYPLALNRAAKLFPPWLLTASMSWMAAMANVGGAVVPFIAGAVSSKAGLKSLEPLILAMLVTMLGLWTLIPNYI